MTDASAIASARSAQLAADAAAICTMCADPARYGAAEWREADGGYHHFVKAGRRVGEWVWCDSSLMFMAWAEAAPAVTDAAPGGENGSETK